jgi:tryptophan-rich sensory protein
LGVRSSLDHVDAAHSGRDVAQILNVGWTILFFFLHRPTAALVEIVAFGILLAAMIVTYRKLDRAAAWLLVPYLAWVVFATALNAWIVANN